MTVGLKVPGVTFRHSSLVSTSSMSHRLLSIEVVCYDGIASRRDTDNYVVMCVQTSCHEITLASNSHTLVEKLKVFRISIPHRALILPFLIVAAFFNRFGCIYLKPFVIVFNLFLFMFGIFQHVKLHISIFT